MTEKKRIGLIRVLTTEDQGLLQAHGRIIESCFPSFSVESRCIADQYEGIHDEATEALAIPKVVKMGQELAKEGFDAVYVSCAGDPGVRLLQEQLSIPVVGAGIAAAHAAKVCGIPVGILGITDETPSEVARILGSLVVGSLRPERIHTTLDLFRPEAINELTAAGHELRSRGARMIVLACTGLATINAAPALSRRVGVPVIDPLRAAAAMLWTALC